MNKGTIIALALVGVLVIGGIAFVLARRQTPAPQLQPTVAPAPVARRERSSGPSAGEIIGAVATVVGQFAVSSGSGGKK